MPRPITGRTSACPICLHFHSRDLGCFPSCCCAFCGAYWTVIRTVIHGTAHSSPLTTAVLSQSWFRNCSSSYPLGRSWLNAPPMVTQQCGPQPKLVLQFGRVCQTKTQMMTAFPLDMFPSLRLRALPRWPAKHLQLQQRRLPRLPRSPRARRSRQRLPFRRSRCPAHHHWTQPASCPAPTFRRQDHGPIRSWVRGAGVCTCTFLRTRPPPPSSTLLVMNTRSRRRQKLYHERQQHRRRCLPDLLEGLNEAMYLGPQPTHQITLEAQMAVSTCSAELRGAKQLTSIDRRPLLSHVLIATQYSFLSVSACSGQATAVSRGPHGPLSVSISATALPPDVRCTPLRWHASYPSHHVSGSTLQEFPQLCRPLSCTYICRPCMATDSNLPASNGNPDDEVLRLYRSLEWTTRTPPPLTVYLQPYLRDLLSRRAQTAPTALTSDTGSRRTSTQTAPSGNKPVATDRRAPRTPPGAASSKELAAQGRLPSRPRAPKHARDRSPPDAAPRRRSRCSSSSRSRTPPKDPQRRLPIPRRRSGDDEATSERISSASATSSKAEIATQGPDGMWYLRPKPKRYPLAPSRKEARSTARQSEAPGPRPKGSVREQLDTCHTCPAAVPSNSKSPKQPAHDTQALPANSSSTVPSESSAVTSSPGALIDAFFKTTDAAAKRVYMECCDRASLCSLPTHAILQSRCQYPAFRSSSGQPLLQRTLLGGFHMLSLRSPGHLPLGPRTSPRTRSLFIAHLRTVARSSGHLPLSHIDSVLHFRVLSALRPTRDQTGAPSLSLRCFLQPLSVSHEDISIPTWAP